MYHYYPENRTCEYNVLVWVHTTITHKNCVSENNGLWYTIITKNKGNNSVLVITKQLLIINSYVNW